MNSYGVVIPAFNAAGTICEALASVLDQNVTPDEIIVVDDGSTDDTANLARNHHPGVRVVAQRNTGPGGASSRGIRALKTPIVALLDADDIWLPHKMDRQLAALREQDGMSLVACNQRQFLHGRPDDFTGEVRPGIIRSGLAFRREAFEMVGDIIDFPGNRGDMIDWLARARRAGCRIQLVDEVLFLRRIIPGSVSYGRDPSKDMAYLRIAHEAMKLQRGALGKIPE